MTTIAAAPPARDAAMPIPPDAALLMMVIIWAVNFSVAKVALSSVSPLAFNALRFPLAAAVVVGTLRVRGPIPLPAPGDRMRVLWLGILGNLVYQQFFIFGLDRTLAGTASVLLAGTPIITAMLSALVGHEKVGKRSWTGAFATVVGMVLVVGTGATGGGSLLGNLLLVCASVSWAGYTVGARPLVDRYGPLTVTAWTLTVGTIGVVLAGVPDLLRTDVTGLPAGVWAAVVYAGAFSIGVAYLIWNYGVRHLGNTRTAVYSNLVPVFALAIAWLWLAEVPSPRQLVGAAVIIAGVSFVQARRAKRQARRREGST